MAYATEKDAGFRFTAVAGITTALGRVSAMIERIIVRERLQADGNNYPVSRPVDEKDGRVTVNFLDNGGGVLETAAAANITASYTQADGGAGSVVIGPLVAGTIKHDWRRKMGGFGMQQEFEQEGDLVYTPTA